MSVFSQPLSTCSRTTDFSFCFNNSAFSDAVLVLLTLRPKGASMPWRLASSMAQLFVSAVEASAVTISSTVPVGDTWSAAGKALGSLGHNVVSKITPKDSQEVCIATIYQVNSALLAASSPFLRHLIQHPQQLQHLVPGLASVAARHRQRKLVAVLLQPHHVGAAESVIRFIFTNDIALTSAQQALDALLVAEQLQVPDCAEVCQHYLQDCAMDWPTALTLVHLQHRHQQEQTQQRQQQWQQQQQGAGSLPRSSSGTSVASSRRPGMMRPPLAPGARGSSSSSGGGGVLKGLEGVAPPLPVPSESVYLQALLQHARDFLVHQFEDLEVVLASSEGRQRLLLLPYDALRAILGHPRLRLASENTALLAAAGWLQANASQASSLLLSNNNSSGSSSGSGSGSGLQGGSNGPSSGSNGLRQGLGNGAVQGVYSSALYNSSSNGLVEPAKAAPAAAAAAATTQADGPVKQNGNSTAAAAAAAAVPATPHHQQQPQQQAAPPAACGAASLLLDLCQVLRLCQCSYTYVLHVLPQLPVFKQEPRLVAALQFEVLRYRAAGSLRQRRLAAEAAAVAAEAAAATAPPGLLMGQHLTGLEQQQHQHGGSRRVLGGSSGSEGSGEGAKAAAAAAAAGGGGVVCEPRGGLGWRSGCAVDAALLQCQPRPDSAATTLDFTFTFDPQALGSSTEQQPPGRGSSGSNALLSAAAAGSNGGSSGVELMQRLLGLGEQQQQQGEATVVSEEHLFAGYAWSMVAAADGFVGVSWKVVLPGGGEVALSGPTVAHQQGAAAVVGGSWGVGQLDGGKASWPSSSSGLRLFGPDCAGFRSPEVAVTFSITSTNLGPRSGSGSSGSLAAYGSQDNTAAAAAAKSGNSSKADNGSLAAAGTSNNNNNNNSSSGGKTPQKQQQQGTTAVGSSPVKGSKAVVVGRAYSEVQFVPAHCAWGFPDFAAGGWEALKGPDGKVCLRCQLRHRE